MILACGCCMASEARFCPPAKLPFARESQVSRMNNLCMASLMSLVRQNGHPCSEPTRCLIFSRIEALATHLSQTRLHRQIGAELDLIPPKAAKWSRWSPLA